MIVSVGSTNPVKINAVKSAFKKVFPGEKITVYGCKAQSGVSNQPMSDNESIKGARNRALKALNHLDADYGVGIEGGLQKIDNIWFDCGWIIVVDKNKNEGIGSTIRMITPPVIFELIEKGMELGDAIDKIFNKKNSKQNEGHFGLMTHNIITRSIGYKDGVISALVRFINPQLF